MGNLRRWKRQWKLAAPPLISGDPEIIRHANRLILPGVGAFGDAMENLRRHKLDDAIRESVSEGTPLLGLCLGLQLLFTDSDEFGKHEGLNLIPGKVRRFEEPDLRVPHVGWNQIEGSQPNLLMTGIPEGSYFYFVHSYYVEPDNPDHVLRWTSYGRRFCSIAWKDHVWGAQFHPEKSQDSGKKLLRNFLSLE
jgi:glutamine amidotransferase